MTKEQLHRLFGKYDVPQLVFEIPCHDCKKKTEVTVDLGENGFIVSGGAVYQISEDEKFQTKCPECFAKNRQLDNFQVCEVYSRVVGYLRPLQNWHESKKAEFADRSLFDRTITA
jgi:hypothetical protein